jgi:hexulose-6-phosphate isomerase
VTGAVGIMQGRLLPPVDGRVQSFPREGWEREFPLAAAIGFQSIELTIETASWDIHPVRSAAGRARLAELSGAHGIAFAGLCCDSVMEHPLVSDNAATRGRGRDILFDLIDNAAAAGLPMIELPMLGANSLAKAPALAAFEAVLDEALVRADGAGLDILLEADLDGPTFAAFLARHDHPRLGVNYDTGNSTYFGFDPEDEIPAYGPRIRNVHIKDCTRADYSVPLGRGETKFSVVAALLQDVGYRGGFVLQAARQQDDLAAARDYLTFVRALIGGRPRR